jgi:hypothetical protein
VALRSIAQPRIVSPEFSPKSVASCFVADATLPFRLVGVREVIQMQASADDDQQEHAEWKIPTNSFAPFLLRYRELWSKSLKLGVTLSPSVDAVDAKVCICNLRSISQAGRRRCRLRNMQTDWWSGVTSLFSFPGNIRRVRCACRTSRPCVASLAVPMRQGRGTREQSATGMPGGSGRRAFLSAVGGAVYRLEFHTSTRRLLQDL